MHASRAAPNAKGEPRTTIHKNWSACSLSEFLGPPVDRRRRRRTPMSKLLCSDVARAGLGEPAEQRGAELFYHAPWRIDRHPSLQINTVKNTWADFPGR